jgi:hypothetical protein
MAFLDLKQTQQFSKQSALNKNSDLNPTSVMTSGKSCSEENTQGHPSAITF